MSSTGKEYSLGEGLYLLAEIFLEIKAEMQKKQAEMQSNQEENSDD